MRLELSAAINHQLPCRPSMALCDNGVQTTRRPPGDSVSLEKALGPSLAAAEHRAAEGDLAGAVVPQTSPVASARRRLALPAGGKVVVAAAESVLEKAGEREVPAGRKEKLCGTVAMPVISSSLLQTLNKNNLIPDDRTNFYPLQQTNVYTTTYYPSTLNKYDYRPEASLGRTFTNS